MVMQSGAVLGLHFSDKRVYQDLACSTRAIKSSSISTPGQVPLPKSPMDKIGPKLVGTKIFE
jgi:hypothetical protein